MVIWRAGLAFAVVWAMGCQGSAGPTGAPGAAGPAGAQGTPGPSGAQGEPGARGPSGTPGADGTNGDPGAPGEDGEDAVTRGALQGTVTDADGAPLADATVLIRTTDSRVRTDAAGAFAFPDLPMGVYALQISLDGYHPWRDDAVAVFPDTVTPLQITLSPVIEALVTGRVLTADGRAVAGAEVFTDFGGHRGFTDADGAFALTVLPTEYALSAWAPGTGFGTASAVGVRPAPGDLVEVDLVLPIAGLRTPTYVGSSACAGCHAGTYARWNSSVHAHSVRPIDVPGDAGKGPVVSAPWAGEVVLSAAGLPDLTVRLVRTDSGAEAFELDDAVTGETRRYPVSHTYGAGHGRFKQRYMVRLDDTLRLSPLQYNEATGEWVAYHLERWVDAQGRLLTPSANTSFESSCQGCHSTGLRLEANAEDVVTATYTELNTGCENCHGPGSLHIQSPRSDTIVNPRRLYPDNTFGIIGFDGSVADADAWAGFQRAQATCGGCHVRGHSKTEAGEAGRFEFPWIEARGPDGQLTAADALADGFVAGDGLWDDTRFDRVPSSRQHHQQYSDDLNAGAGGVAHGRNPFNLVACFDCHDPHGGPLDSALKLPARDNTLCLDCHGPHGFADEVEITAHTLHVRYAPGTTGSGQCIGCHMPHTAKSAIDNDISSHTFHIVAPHESAAQTAAGAPAMRNSCDGCHVEDADLGVARFEIFFGAPEAVED